MTFSTNKGEHERLFAQPIDLAAKKPKSKGRGSSTSNISFLSAVDAGEGRIGSKLTSPQVRNTNIDLRIIITCRM